MIYDQEQEAGKKKEISEPASTSHTACSGSARRAISSVGLDSTLGLDIDLSRAFDHQRVHVLHSGSKGQHDPFSDSMDRILGRDDATVGVGDSEAGKK